MLIDIRADHLSLVQSILKAHIPESRVIAFGSRAGGRASDTSDLDLCVMSGQRLPFETMGNLKFAFADSDLPYKVDIVDWWAISADFQRHILQKCVEIQAAR